VNGTFIEIVLHRMVVSLRMA